MKKKKNHLSYNLPHIEDFEFWNTKKNKTTSVQHTCRLEGAFEVKSWKNGQRPLDLTKLELNPKPIIKFCANINMQI